MAEAEGGPGDDPRAIVDRLVAAAANEDILFVLLELTYLHAHPAGLTVDTCHSSTGLTALQAAVCGAVNQRTVYIVQILLIAGATLPGDGPRGRFPASTSKSLEPRIEELLRVWETSSGAHESFAESRRLMGEDLGEVEGWLIEEELEPPGLEEAPQEDIKALVEVDACPVAAQGEEMSSSSGLLVSPAVCETSETPDTAVDRIKEEPGQRCSTTDSPPSRTIDSIDLTADSPPSSPPAPSCTPSSPPILPTIPNIPSTSLTSAIPRTPLPRDSPPRRTRKAFDDLKAEYPPVLRIKFNDLDPRTTSQDLVDLVQATVPPDSFRNTYVHFLPSGDLHRLPISFGFVDFTCVDAAHKLLDFYRGATACPLSSKERGTFKVHQVPCPRFLLTHLPYALEAKGALQGLLRFEIGARGNIRYVRDRDGELGAIINILTDRDASQVEQYLRKHPEVVMEMEWERLGELGGTAPGPGRDRTGSNSIEVVRTSLKREWGGGEEQERNGLGMGRVDGRGWRDKWTRSP